MGTLAAGPRKLLFNSCLLGAVALSVLSAANATADKRRVFADNGHAPKEYTDPFVWDDIVLRGTVIRVEAETIPAADWFSPATLKYESGRPVDILKKVVRVHEMLRGCTSDSVVVLRNLDGADEEETRRWIARITGHEAILTIRHKQGPHPTWVLFNTYVRAGNGWTESWEENADTLLEANIRERVSTLGVSRMTADSDLVIRGTILSRRDVGVPGNSYPEYVVQPTVVLKGAAGNSVTVKAKSSISFTDGSQWRSLLGADPQVGTSWYLFLVKRQDGTFQPAAAWRSTFKIDGDRLFERTDTPSCYTPSSLENEIRSAARG